MEFEGRLFWYMVTGNEWLEGIPDWGKSENKDTEVEKHGTYEEEREFCFAGSQGTEEK